MRKGYLNQHTGGWRLGFSLFDGGGRSETVGMFHRFIMRTVKRKHEQEAIL